MRGVSGEQLTVATLNTRGIPVTGSRLADRYAVIGAGVDAGDVDVACFQGGVHVLAPAAAGPADAVVPAGELPAHAGGPGRRSGHWSEANRFYPLQRAQFAVLTQVATNAGSPAVVCGDFNIDRESSLFGEFRAATGLADAFGGACPPTFRAEYLPAGATPHCIISTLTAGEVRVETAALGSPKKEPLGYVSDHIGLCTRLFLTPAGRASEIGGVGGLHLRDRGREVAEPVPSARGAWGWFLLAPRWMSMSAVKLSIVEVSDLGADKLGAGGVRPQSSSARSSSTERRRGSQPSPRRPAGHRWY